MLEHYLDLLSEKRVRGGKPTTTTATTECLRDRRQGRLVADPDLLEEPPGFGNIDQRPGRSEPTTARPPDRDVRQVGGQHPLPQRVKDEVGLHREAA